MNNKNYDTKIFDSDDEYYFSLWLEEALEMGVIKSWKKCKKGIDTMEVIPKKTYEKKKVKKLKKGDKIIWKEAELLKPLKYTPDFIIIFDNDKLLNLFPHSNVMSHSSYKIIIDTKSEAGNKYGKNQSAVTFPIIQKILYHLKSIYVQKITYKQFFRETWCPKELYWMKNRKKPTKTKLGKQSRLIEEYMKKNDILQVIDNRVVEVNNMIRNIKQ